MISIYEQLLKQDSIINVKEEHKFHEVRVYDKDRNLKRVIPSHDLRERYWKRFFFGLEKENPRRGRDNKEKEMELTL